MLPYLIFAFGVICNATGNVFAKRASEAFSTTGFTVQSVVSNYNMFVGIALFGLSFVAYIVSLGKISLHVAYPLFVSSSIILVTTASVVLFGESVSFLNILGIAAIITGIALLVTT